ncbi:MAG: hypothetical protein HOB79_20250 [Rhodospirillaceae bacterium]|jgi:hypothetical protein|nr:hypothetical protein [Rhodospirillaceae bacterium]
MKPEVWLECILEVLEEIADRSYQRQAWFGKGESISSPTEVYCSLFDDFMFDDFLASSEFKLTPEQRELAEILRVKMNRFSDVIGDQPDPNFVLDHPTWIEVSALARDLVATFK